MLSALLPAGASPDLDQRRSTFSSVESQRGQMLAGNLITSLVISIINATIIASLLAFEANAPGIWLWYGSLIGLSAIRIAYVRQLADRQPTVDMSKINLVVFLTALAGILWGALPLIFSAYASDILNHMMVFIVAGMTAGACIAFATHIRLVIAFNLPTLVLLIIHYALIGTSISYAMCATMFLYFVITLGLARNSSDAVEHALHNQAVAERQRVEILEKKKFLDAEVVARLQTESQLTHALDQSRKFNTALERICSAYIAQGRTTKSLVDEANEQIAEAIGINRVGIWSITPDNAAFESLDLYDELMDAHQSRMRLELDACPAYFQAVRANQIVNANDAQSDERTKQLVESYLKPNQIRSKLDVPIFAANSLWGVISCESTGEFHAWSVDEIAFVSSAAQFISMSLLAEESERLTAELKTALMNAENANAAKSEFLATMSHEIRTPMNGVIGAASILSKMKLDAEMQRFVHIINDSASSLLYLLNNILDLSKLEAGRMEFEETPFQLDTVIEKVVAVHSLKAIEKSISFDVTITPDVINNRFGDAHRITQILHNLLSNAIKFTHDGGVTINVTEAKDEFDGAEGIIIDVKDTGIGMTPAQVERIFEVFTQADSSTTRQYGGTGLGVSIVDGIVSAMGGTINVTSKPNTGSTFSIAVPLKTHEPSSESDDSQLMEQTLSALNGANILVADDNAANGLIMDAFLRRLCAKPTIVDNGRKALEERRRGEFNLILMDINMPEMDGIRAFDAIRKFETENKLDRIPIIAVTADALEHQVRTYLDHGFDGHLAKPVNETRLIEAIENTIFSYGASNVTILEAHKKRKFV